MEDRYRSDQIDPGSGFDPFSLDIDADIKSQRHNLELTHFLSPRDDLKLIWGLVAQLDYVQSPLFLGSESNVSHKQYRGFATIEWNITNNDVINVGSLFEKHDLSNTAFSPRASFTHAFNRQHKVRIGVSQAFRGPFIFETVGNQNYSQELTVGGTPIGLSLYEQVITGNESLKNEKIVSREIAYFAEFLNSALLFNGRFFYDSITNYIDTLRVPAPADDNVQDDLTDLTDPNSPNTTLVFTNPISSTTRGIELELNYHIDASLRLIASGAIINISSNSNAASDSAPHHSYSFLLTKQFNEKYNTSVGYYFVEQFIWMDARGTKNYQILDLRLSRNFKTNTSNGSISLVIKNLLGDYSDYNTTPRNSAAPQVIQSTAAYIDLRLSF